MAPRSVVRGFDDVHELLQVGVVCAKLTIGLAKIVEGKGCSVLLVWVAKVAIEGYKEGSEAIKEDLEGFFTAVVCGFVEVDPHRSLFLTCSELVCVAQLVLGVLESGAVARGFQHKLVLENLQFFSGSVESIGISYFLGSGCELGGGGLGGEGKAGHDHLGMGQPLLEPVFAGHVILALCTEAGDELIGG